ncbi:MAG: hypothetical protein M5U28_26660 [Sandaracinaceae bacterium]|nr:hypothetical protein [Sandaracinaceae bacterium]
MAAGAAHLLDGGARAPRGVVEAGGWVGGFLYFDAVEVEARAVTLRVHVDLPQREERVATIDIAFTPAAS